MGDDLNRNLIGAHRNAVGLKQLRNHDQQFLAQGIETPRLGGQPRYIGIADISNRGLVIECGLNNEQCHGNTPAYGKPD